MSLLPVSTTPVFAGNRRRYLGLALLSACLSLPVCSVGQVSAHAGAAASAPHGMTQLPTQLASGISSQNAKVGQELLARVTQPAALADGTPLPAGSQLLGHVTAVKSLAGNNGVSRLGMVFDQLKTPDGQVKKIRSMVQNLQPAGGQISASTSSETQGNASGDLLGGVGGAVGGVVNTATGALGAVTGLPGVLLSQAGGGSGLLSSKGSNVSLASGTQITLSVAATAN